MKNSCRKLWSKRRGPPLNEHLAGVSWLFGKWRSEDGQGTYPTLKDFKFGVCEVEEGEVNGQEMITTPHTAGQLTFGKDPATKKIKRLFRREGDILQQIVEMETDKTPMAEHFRITYKKMNQKTTENLALTGPPLNEHLKGVSWLLGKWRSEDGHGTYPTLKDFKFGEEVEFTHVGQPNLQFSCCSWYFETKKPKHRELGFVRVQPDTNKVGLIIAQNLGVCEVEEGEVNGQEMITTSHTVGQLTFGRDPATRKVKRTFRREGDTLQKIIEMETDKTPLAEHVRITYKKMD